MRNVLFLLALAPLTGCTSGETWAAVETERRRILAELKKELPPDRHDRVAVIVLDRPRTKPESIVSGYDHAITRVNRERLALAEYREKFRQMDLAHDRDPKAWNAPKDRDEWKSDAEAWDREVGRAQQLLLVAEACHAGDDWLPVADILVHSQFQKSRARITARAVPDTENLRVERAARWFADWQQRFWAKEKP